MLDWKIIFALLLVITLMALPMIRRSMLKDVQFIEPIDLFKMFSANDPALRMLDIRKAKAFAHQSIQGAINVDLPLKDALVDVAGRIQAEPDEKWVLIGGSDLEAAKFVSALTKQGVACDNVSVLRGGFSFWSRKNLPLNAPES